MTLLLLAGVVVWAERRFRRLTTSLGYCQPLWRSDRDWCRITKRLTALEAKGQE